MVILLSNYSNEVKKLMVMNKKKEGEKNASPKKEIKVLNSSTKYQKKKKNSFFITKRKTSNKSYNRRIIYGHTHCKFSNNSKKLMVISKEKEGETNASPRKQIKILISST